MITRDWGLQIYSESDRYQSSARTLAASEWEEISLTVDHNLDSGTYQWWQAGFFQYKVYVNG
jgi:hypothetical protein